MIGVFFKAALLDLRKIGVVKLDACLADYDLVALRCRVGSTRSGIVVGIELSTLKYGKSRELLVLRNVACDLGLLERNGFRAFVKALVYCRDKRICRIENAFVGVRRNDDLVIYNVDYKITVAAPCRRLGGLRICGVADEDFVGGGIILRLKIVQQR